MLNHIAKAILAALEGIAAASKAPDSSSTEALAPQGIGTTPTVTGALDTIGYRSVSYWLHVDDEDDATLLEVTFEASDGSLFGTLTAETITEGEAAQFVYKVQVDITGGAGTYGPFNVPVRGVQHRARVSADAGTPTVSITALRL